jgi:hypothetical protein
VASADGETCFGGAGLIGFTHSMPNYTGAFLGIQRAQSAIQTLEFGIHHSKVDPEHSNSQSRLQLISDMWPRE